MKPLAIAAAVLLALLPRPGVAQARETPASNALVERLLAVLPDRDEIGAVGTDIDAAELAGLVALNPGKEAQIRPILEASLACTAPAITAGTLRMFRKIGLDLGEAKLKRLIGFYQGPDYAVFSALAQRMSGTSAPSPDDKAAMAALMEAYPLQEFSEALNHGEEIMATDPAFMGAAMKCASEQMAAMEAAGLKSN
jgi:hypothetical protein